MRLFLKHESFVYYYSVPCTYGLCIIIITVTIYCSKNIFSANVVNKNKEEQYNNALDRH